MCKILISTGITNSKNALKFMRVAKAPMSKADRDGIGYLAVDSDGQMFSERWHNNNDFMSSMSIDPTLRKIDTMIDENLGDYSSYGVVNTNDIKTFALHTRFATCGREFQNTHPFINDGVGLIHNGVIRNADKLTNRISTCDSETILNEYLTHDVIDAPSKIKQVTDALQGYWALGIIGQSNTGRTTLDVLKNSTATLFVASIKELGKDNITFCTTKDILVDALESLKWNSKIKIYKVRGNVMTRFDAITGESIGSFESTDGIATTFDNVITKSNWKTRYKPFAHEQFEASDSKYNKFKYDELDLLGAEQFYANFEDYVDTELDWDLQSVYWDLSYEARQELETMAFESAVDYLQKTAQEFYAKQAK